jgi:hypothetical protein
MCPGSDTTNTTERLYEQSGLAMQQPQQRQYSVPPPDQQPGRLPLQATTNRTPYGSKDLPSDTDPLDARHFVIMSGGTLVASVRQKNEAYKSC